jgi:hypothetical protein
VLDAALDEYIKHHDPVVKARRAQARIEKLREKHGAHEGAICGEITTAPSARSSPSSNSSPSSSSSSSSNYPASYPLSRGERSTEPATNQKQTPSPISDREAHINKDKLLRTRRVFSGDTESSKASDPDDRHGLNQRDALNQGLVRDKVAEACVSQPLPQTHPALPRETNARTKCGSKISKAPTPPPTQTRTQAQAQALTLRRPLSASEKHAVFLRDQGRCTFVNARGERCNTDRWLHVHHIKPVSQGGTNDPANLTVICSAHHDLIHQLSFALDGQISWLRAPTVAYVA